MQFQFFSASLTPLYRYLFDKHHHVPNIIESRNLHKYLRTPTRLSTRQSVKNSLHEYSAAAVQTKCFFAHEYHNLIMIVRKIENYSTPVALSVMFIIRLLYFLFSHKQFQVFRQSVMNSHGIRPTQILCCSEITVMLLVFFAWNIYRCLYLPLEVSELTLNHVPILFLDTSPVSVFHSSLTYRIKLILCTCIRTDFEENY